MPKHTTVPKALMRPGRSSMKRIPLKGGDEYDALTKARRYTHWGRGQLKKIKKAYNKRLRKLNNQSKVNTEE